MRPTKPARLWQHPNGVWYVRTEGGRRVSCGTADRREAEAFFARFVAGLTSPAAPAVPTVKSILDGYLEERRSRVRAWDTLRYAAQALTARLGPLTPSDLTASVLRDYAAHRAASGRRDGTVIREIVTLRAALKWAAAERWIPSPPPLPMPVSAPPPRDRWLTRPEAAKLIEAASITPHLRLFILLGLMTGARSGAILGLTWDRVDLDAKLIDYGPGHGNKRRVVIPISKPLHDALTAAQAARTTDWVVEFGGRPVGSVKKAFGRAVERAGLVDVTPHILRHTCATWAVQAGVPLAEVARMLGDSEAMIEQVYGKHAPDFLRRAVDAVSVQ